MALFKFEMATGTEYGEGTLYEAELYRDAAEYAGEEMIMHRIFDPPGPFPQQFWFVLKDRLAEMQREGMLDRV